MKTILLIVLFAIGGTIAARLRRSTGGEEIEDAAFFVAIMENCVPTCGGALISSQHVLTAAHCVVNESLKKYTNITVRSGINKLESGGTCHGVKDAIPAPGYTPNRLKNDIAVIILSSRVRLDTTMQLPSLPIAEPQYRKVAKLITLETRIADERLILQEIEVKMTPAEQCIAYERERHIHGRSKFCGFNDVGQKLHAGDSGSPLVHHGQVVGIVSQESELGEQVFYYTNVHKFVSFIKGAQRCSLARCAIL